MHVKVNVYAYLPATPMKATPMKVNIYATAPAKQRTSRQCTSAPYIHYRTMTGGDQYKSPQDTKVNMLEKYTVQQYNIFKH